MNAPGFICTLRGPQHIYDLVNPSYQKLFGKRKIQGKPIIEAFHDDVTLRTCKKCGAVMTLPQAPAPL